MADFDDWNTDTDTNGGAGGGAPRIQGGLLDPRTFPSPWPPAADDPAIDKPAPELSGPLDTDVHAQVLQDILDAQAKLPPLDRPAPAITGPLMTDAHGEVLQDILNAQAGLPPVKPHPETWLVNGQPYLAISAETYDPGRSNHLTSMPSPADSAAAFTGRSLVGVPYGTEERTGYIAHLPAPLTASDVDPATGLASQYRIQSEVLRAPGRPEGSDRFDTYTSARPSGSPAIHGHIDRRSDSQAPSDGMVDNTEAFEGYGDADSLRRSDHEPTATVSHGQVGWHVLDNGQLKFLYPTGSMMSSQIRQMQKNLDDEQKKFLRPQ